MTERRCREAPLTPGMRVRLRAPSPLLTLRSALGTVVAPDAYLDYYVIRLDAPAIYDNRITQEELDEVVESRDNMEVLSP
jgi:hypothetical protein